MKAVKADPKDNMILSCAVEGGADFIVSGDEHLKVLKVYEGIRILEPARLLEKVDIGE